MAGETPRPLPASVQLLESRGFERLYSGNPTAQARFIETMLGYRATLMELHIPSGEEQRTIDAVDGVIRSFAATYPEFLEEVHKPGSGKFSSDVYVADPRILELAGEVINRA